MTYLERLVRRARMTPAVPGAALRDPFEQIADWPLETPVTQAAAPPAIAPQAAALAPPAAAPMQAPPDDSGPPPVPIVMPAPPLETPGRLVVDRVASPGNRETQEPDRGNPGERPPVLAPPEPDSAAALRTADEFMHRLGARLPAPPSEAPRLAAPEPVAPAPLARGPQHSLDPPARVAPISPPAAPLPALPRLFSSPVAAPAITPRQDAGARPADRSAPRPRPSTETRRIVVVERRGGAPHERDVHGGGAPRFGLGQI